MKILLGALILAIGTGIFLFWAGMNITEVVAPTTPVSLEAPEAVSPPLADPPKMIKAIYLTGWSAGNPSKINYLINLVKTTEINAVVIDVKDYSGYVAYDIKVPEVEKYKAEEIKIPQINRLIKQLHDEGIYAIARITIFQDPRLAEARPDLAVKSKKTGAPWLDRKKLTWIDPAAKDAWDYNIAIAKETSQRGFDEINFDYIRFPSDGDLEDMEFPFWDGKSPESSVIRNFFKVLRQELAGVKISADLFGLATINRDDLGIGQIIENAFEYFDFVSPMVYPSHYASGFLGYKNPALYPYEVVKYSMDSAFQRLKNYELGIMNNATTTATSTNMIRDSRSKIQDSKLRPWLQDFDLGADYNAETVQKEIQAVFDAATSTPELLNGFMLWSPSNIYSLISN